MKESLKKFKNKILMEIQIKSAVFGISFGVIFLSVLLLIFKLSGINIHFLNYIWIGIVLCAIGYGISFFILKPNMKKMAKRIDEEFHLNEKVQTMLQNEDNDSFMANIQREDTIERLNQIPKNSLKMKFHYLIGIIPAIACIFLIVAIAVPLKATTTEEPEIIDPDYDMDDWTILAIKNLIHTVKNSDLEENVKTEYIENLNQLIINLSSSKKESEMKEYVLKTINTILNSAMKFNSCDEIADVLINSEIGNVRRLATALRVANVEQVRIIFEYIESSILDVDDSITSENIANFRINYGNLLKDSNLNKEDNLYKCMVSISDKITGIDANNIKSIFKEFLMELEMNLAPQELNISMAQYIEIELRKIFGIKKDPQQNTDSNENSGSIQEGENEEHGGQGSPGSGETKYGSDDAFFDPEKGNVVYGDVINKYYSMIVAAIQDGTISQELQEFYTRYFEILYGKQMEEHE